ncbi:MAG TPA: D-2-hydroxyacid dehydrogenase [Acidimicrobiia bacterium]|nr:D-2-hydroxyacid dehydrogenase [Acidimicrobiia bacterium]
MSRSPTGSVVVAYPWHDREDLLDRVRAVLPGVEVRALPYVGKFGQHVRDKSTYDELTDERRAVWARAEVVMALDLPTGIDELAPNLRWVQAIGAGIEHLDDRGIGDGVVVTNAVGVAAVPIAEFVIARLLAVWKRFDALDDLQRKHEWRATFGRVFDGSVVGLVGLGAIGSAVAVRARALGAHTVGIRRSYRPGDTSPSCDELYGTDSFTAVLARCDAVVLSAPATPETENMFDADAFAAMKPGAVFCNVARGSLVDEAALVDALERGHLGAAVLDVARTEPLPPDDPLWDAPNIFISPHSSASQDRYLETLFELFVDNLGRYARGESLRNVVDRTAGY